MGDFSGGFLELFSLERSGKIQPEIHNAKFKSEIGSFAANIHTAGSALDVTFQTLLDSSLEVRFPYPRLTSIHPTVTSI